MKPNETVYSPLVCKTQSAILLFIISHSIYYLRSQLKIFLVDNLLL